MSKVNDVLPTVSPQTPDEYYAQWVDREGVNAEKIRDDSLTAIQRAYDRSSATYGATAEMLRQSGLNNSGLAGLYQNMAETNRRQGNATVYDQYAANVKSNKSRFAAHNQEIQGKIYEQAMTMPEATMQDLQAIAAMYGVDPITAQQMAQSAWDSTTDIRERGLQAKYTEAYNEAYKEINEIASQGGNLNAEAIASRFPDLGADALSVVQGIINERKENYSSVYAAKSANNMATDLVNGTLKESDLSDPAKREELAKKYAIPEKEIESAIANAQTAYDEYKGEKNASDHVTAQNNISGKSVGFEVTDDMVKDFASSLGISEDIARQYLYAERDKTISAANEIWRLYKEEGAFFHSPDEVKNELDDYYGIDYFTKEEARLIYNNYVDKYTANLKKDEEAKLQEKEANLDFQYDKAVASGDTKLQNEIGDKIVSQAMSDIINGGGADDDGETAFDVLELIYSGDTNNGQGMSKIKQYATVLDQAVFDVRSLNVKSVNSKSIKIDAYLGGTTYSMNLSVHDNPTVFSHILSEKYPSAKNGDFGVSVDSEGRHLSVFYDGSWYWIKKEDATGHKDDITDEQWGFLWEALAETNQRNTPSVSKPTVSNKQDGVFENFYDTISDAKLIEAQKYINDHGMKESERGLWGHDKKFLAIWNELTENQKKRLIGVK